MYYYSAEEPDHENDRTTRVSGSFECFEIIAIRNSRGSQRKYEQHYRLGPRSRKKIRMKTIEPNSKVFANPSDIGNAIPAVFGRPDQQNLKRVHSKSDVWFSDALPGPQSSTVATTRLFKH
jgi:hypothetical protein